MKMRLWILCLCFVGLPASGTVGAADRVTIAVPSPVVAGSAQTVTVTVADATVGDAVRVTLRNGLQRHDRTLTLGSGRVARWALDTSMLTQAGTSLLTVYINEDSVQHTLKVLPAEAHTVDLFTTANDIPAYGVGTATALLLARDAHGNALADHAGAMLTTRYPDGTTTQQPFTLRGGLGWLPLRSQGGPGRVRLTLEGLSIDAALELTQSAGEAASITLDILPPCLPDDGRERAVLQATVRDAFANAVPDGTLVTFRWAGGFGTSPTTNGVAALRVVPRTPSAAWGYVAQAGDAVSPPATLFVIPITEGCPDAP